MRVSWRDDIGGFYRFKLGWGGHMSAIDVKDALGCGIFLNV